MEDARLAAGWTRRQAMECREAEQLAELELDGEIDAEARLEWELHLTGCAACKHNYDRSRWAHRRLRGKLLDSVESSALVPPERLRERVLRDLRDEEKRSDSRLWPRVAAATAMAVIGAGALGLSAQEDDDPFIEESIARHSRNLPPEVRASARDQGEVDRFLERNLPYRVAAPRFGADRLPVRLVGARLASIRDRDVAYIMYDHRGAKLSVFAYPARSESEHPRGFEVRRVGAKTVLVGRRRGYNVVSWRDQQHALRYSLVSDADPNELVRLASDVH